ncbi:MAG: bifunctional ornithine acetyltransferase/N-acetylglutamate synthase [Kiritimatiellae bacterium]|nr:bifunctional ornithine acetyltransferase/N-acetylglutamate synthase [Kiritimatiellia bacterium]
MEFATEQEHRAWLATQAALPAGFRTGKAAFAFTPAEVPKPARMTLTVIALDAPTPDFAAVFTRNAFPGAPVLVGRRRLSAPQLGAIVVNNKISNVCAPGGVEAAERVCAEAARLLKIDANAVLPSSTGVIGWRLPVEPMCGALPEAIAALQARSVLPAAEGIMTTDLYPKVRRAEVGAGRIVGIAKGAGMIEPNLATMLVYLLTDLAVPREHLRAALARAVEPSFNAISVDSDQSTSDTVVLLASGRVPCEEAAAFDAALLRVCAALAEDVVRNGEGVKHVVRCAVRHAPSAAIAKAIGKSVINSPLMQCAICGNDPNIGRLVMAVGKCVGNQFPDLDLSACTLTIGPDCVFANGAFRIDPAVEARLSAYLKDAELYASKPPDANGVFRPAVTWPAHERTVEMTVDLARGRESFTVLGCDRTHEYISENADYRS